MKYITINLPLDLNKEIVLLAEDQKKTVADVFRTALRQYAAKLTVEKVRSKLKKHREKYTEFDIENIIDESRK